MIDTRFIVLMFLITSCIFSKIGYCQSILLPEDQKNLRNVVLECIKTTRSSKPNKSMIDLYGPGFEKYLEGFDAFYNSSSGRVENNAQIVVMQPALFIFNKCMSEHGWPLK